MVSLRSIRRILIFIIMPILLFSAGLFTILSRESSALPVYYNSPSFQLTDAKGGLFSSDTLKGKVWVADFIFTTCQGPCPIMSKNMASLHRSYVLEKDVRMVSFSVNPEYDSPIVLDKYAERYKANQDKWYFLTGDRSVLEKIIIEGFKVGSIEEPMFHSTRFVLVDKRGRIRGFYDGTKDAEIKNLFKDIAQLKKENL